MKKSRRGKNRKQRSSDVEGLIDARLEVIINEQLKAFIKKFGRPPREGEPVFFDPDKDVPTELSEKIFDDAMESFLEGAPPHIVYAYEKTGRVLLAELRDTYPPEFVAEYDAAIEEYFELKKAGKLP